MVMVLAMVVMMPRSSPLVAVLLIGRDSSMCLSQSVGGHATLDNLIEFPAIKPNTPALGAIVDFDAGTLGHHKISSSTDWTLHFKTLRMLFHEEHDHPLTLKQAYGLAISGYPAALG
jgi:hypothetical protein